MLGMTDLTSFKGVCTIAVALAAFFILPGYVSAFVLPISFPWGTENRIADQRKARTPESPCKVLLKAKAH